MRLISVPFHLGDPLPGFAAPGPAEVIAPALPAGTAPQRLALLYRALADRVAAAEDCLVYAGDCLAPLGVLAGLQRRGLDPVLVWFDAHGDFHTWQTTRSGYLGGMALAMAIGRGEQTIVQGAGLRPLQEGGVVLVDARDLDPGEREALLASELRRTTVQALDEVLPHRDPVYVHLDVDVVDPREMPALRFPAPGGPSLREVRGAVEELARTGRVLAASLACTWDPGDQEAARAAAATRLLASCFMRAQST